MRSRTALAAITAAVVVAAVGLTIVAIDRGDATSSTAADSTTRAEVAGAVEPSPAEVVSFSLESPLIDASAPGAALADDRSAPKVNVWLPSGYRDDAEATYPVLWLLHGAEHGADAWLDNLETLADGLPAVIVMPDGGRLGMYADWWSGGTRSDPAWATFHLEVLRDEIDQRFRIRDGRRWHAIAGVSMGGQGALRYASLLPGYFGSVATFSAAMPDMQSGIAEVQVAGLGRGAVSYDDVFGPATGAYAEGNSPRALASNLQHTRVFLTSGDGTNCPEDPVDAKSIDSDAAIERVISGEQASYVEAVRGVGADITARTTCGVHTFGVWDRAFTAAREWGFFEPVDEQPTEWIYRTVATAGEVWDHEFEFTAPPSEVVTIERSGDTISATGTGAMTLRHGSCAIELPLPAVSVPLDSCTT